jgi:folate-binding protein YgfZ
MGNPHDWNQVAAAATDPSGAHFGDLQRELDAARTAAVLSPLAHFSLLRVSGADAQPFLQGQLTCDVGLITPIAAGYGGYCTPKGRLLASFLLAASPAGYLMHLPTELAAPVVERLRKYVLRAKVVIEREQSVQAIGIGGPNAHEVLHRIVGEPPRRVLEVVHYPAAALVRLPGDAFLALVPAGSLPPLWAELSQAALPAGAEAWNWLQVHAGIPWITLPTQDKYVPQMVDLDAIGGVSFDKGCYPGQEIVARTHYLGEVKRRLRRGHADGPARAGEAILAGTEVRAGVLNAAPSPAGGTDLLVVAQADGVEALHVGNDAAAAVTLTAPEG